MFVREIGNHRGSRKVRVRDGDSKEQFYRSLDRSIEESMIFLSRIPCGAEIHHSFYAAMLKPKLKAAALKDREGFQNALADWFLANGKDYPWRRTRVPYEILISEVMLQQTQISTVLGKGFYARFLEKFPDAESLAAADESHLLKAWEGLGYYRRVRMLQQTAQAVITQHDGLFPQDVNTLMALPGVGRYTAGALRSFAFNLPASIVDGNVARVLARLMNFSNPVDDTAGQKQIWQWADDLADPVRPQIYNSALMELGQTICRPGVPDCLSCPVATFCQTQTPENLPIKRPKAKTTKIDEHALWLVDPEGRLLLHREGGKRREGLWKLPTREAAYFSELRVLIESHYTVTRYRVTLRVYDGNRLPSDFQTAEDERWWGEDQLEKLAMPSPFRRVIEQLLSES
jgi:A/G-specific adenine glycosylase